MGNLANRVPGALKALSRAQFESNRQQARANLACSGMVEFGKHYVSNSSHNAGEGLFAFPNVPLSIQSGRDKTLSGASGKSVSDYPILNIDGLTIHVTNANRVSGAVNWKLPEAPSAQIETSTTTSRIYKQGNHVVVGNVIYICVSHDDVPSGSNLLDENLFETRELVTQENLVGVEVFCVELGKDIDVVYPTGCVQNQTLEWNGFTLDNTLLPRAYSELGDWQGDEAEAGYGLTWSSMDASERNIWLADQKNNIYEEDGKFFQWQYRLKVTEGQGESWSAERVTSKTNSAIRASSSRTASHSSLLRLRGKRTLSDFKDIGPDNGAIVFTYLHSSRPTEVDWGVAVTRENNGAVTGPVTDSSMAYYLPIATVTRYNKGGYHPIFNPMGTSTFRRQDINGNNAWYYSEVYKPQSVADCFRFTEVERTEGVFPYAGNYDSGKSGHPMGYVHDMAYAHLVNDLRYSAYGANINPEDVAFDLTFGLTPGWEAVKRTVFHKTTITELPNDVRVVLASLPSDDYVGGGWLYNVTKDIYSPCMRYNTSSEYLQTLSPSINPLGMQPGLTTATGLGVEPREGSWEVGDEVVLVMYENTRTYMRKHLQTDVIATPLNIFNWLQGQGTNEVFNLNWIPAIPDGSLKEFKANRRAVAVVSESRTSNDGGENWIGDSSFIDNFLLAPNSNTREMYANQIQLIQYEFNSRTIGYDEEDVNAQTQFTKLPFKDGTFSSVWATTSSDDAQGGLLMQSVLGEVATGNNSTPLRYSLERHGLKYRRGEYLFDGSVIQQIAHTEIDNLDASHGVKYFVSIGFHEDSGLVFAQLHFKKLFYQAEPVPVQTIDLSTAPSVDLKLGDRIKLINTRNSDIEGVILSMLRDYAGTWATATFDEHHINYDDGRVYRANGTNMGIAELAPIGVFGDDGEFVSPSGTSRIDYYQDLNGNLVMVGHLLGVNPLGFLPKKSRR